MWKCFTYKFQRFDTYETIHVVYFSSIRFSCTCVSRHMLSSSRWSNLLAWSYCRIYQFPFLVTLGCVVMTYLSILILILLVLILFILIILVRYSYILFIFSSIVAMIPKCPLGAPPFYSDFGFHTCCLLPQRYVLSLRIKSPHIP